MEDVCVQKLEDHDPHLLIASATESSHRVEPLFTFQFLSGDLLAHVQKFLCDEAFEFTEGLRLKDRSDLLLFSRCALAEHQLTNLMKQRRWRVLEVSLQRFPALELSQLRELTARQLEKLAHLLVDVCSIGRGGQFLPSQKLGNIRLRNFSGSRQVLLLEPQLFQSLLDD